MKPLAIVPCRLGSKGVALKNVTALNGIAPVVRAVRVAREAGCRVMVTSEADISTQLEWGCQADWYHKRPDELAQDDTPMIDVIRDVLESGTDEDGDPVVLVQCTQPLRTPAHIQQALALLTPEVDSVVSVVEIPQTHAAVNHGYISTEGDGLLVQAWTAFAPATRQACGHTYIRDGTAYVCWRRTITKHGNLYGELVRPLIIPPEETCPLDTESDWREAEWRLRERA